jgi:arginase
LGAREFDAPEETFVCQKDISLFSATAINQDGAPPLLSALKQAGFSKLYLHLDLDVIDPLEFPHVACPTPQGIHLNPLKSLLLNLRSEFDVVGFSLLEFLPTEFKASSALEVLELLNIVIPDRP